MRFIFILFGVATLSGLIGCKDISPAEPPSGDFTVSCDSYLCTFEADGSPGDTDGNLGFTWAFGDGFSGQGKRVQHAYSATGTFTVSLAVTDRRGNRSVIQKPLDVVSTSAAAYHSLISGTVGGLIQGTETLRALEAQIIPLQDAIEASITSKTLPDSLECGLQGTATVEDWDGNDDAMIDPEEVIDLVLEDCQFDASENAVDADAGVTFVGRVDNETYTISSNRDNRGIKAVNYGSYRVGGTVDVKKDTGGRLITGNRLRFFRFNSVGTATTEVNFSDPDLFIPFDFQGYKGDFTVSAGNIPGTWRARITEPLVFQEVNGELMLTAGRVVFEQEEGAVMIMELDADPAYVSIEAYAANQTTPAVDSRLEQRMVITRFGEF